MDLDLEVVPYYKQYAVRDENINSFQKSKEKCLSLQKALIMSSLGSKTYFVKYEIVIIFLPDVQKWSSNKAGRPVPEFTISV